MAGVAATTKIETRKLSEWQGWTGGGQWRSRITALIVRRPQLKQSIEMIVFEIFEMWLYRSISWEKMRVGDRWLKKRQHEIERERVECKRILAPKSISGDRPEASYFLYGTYGTRNSQSLHHITYSFTDVPSSFCFIALIHVLGYHGSLHATVVSGRIITPVAQGYLRYWLHFIQRLFSPARFHLHSSIM